MSNMPSATEECCEPSGNRQVISRRLESGRPDECGLCRHEVSVCVCVSVTFVDHVKTNKPRIFSTVR